MSRTARLVAAAALAAAVLPAVGGGTTGAIAADPLYRPLSNFKLSGDKVRIAPERYSAVRVDLAQARAQLRDAPRAGARSGMVFSVPTPDRRHRAVHRAQPPGRWSRSSRRPTPRSRRTPAARSTTPDTTIALDITPMGLHAAVRGPQGQRAWYVDPAYDRPGTSVHLSYYGGAMPRAEDEFVEREAPEIRHGDARGSDSREGGPGRRGDPEGLPARVRDRPDRTRRTSAPPTCSPRRSP